MSTTTLLQLAYRCLIGSAWLFNLALILWQLLRLYPGDRLFPVRLAGIFAPWLSIALLPIIVMALLGRQKRLAYLSSALLLVLGSQYWGLFTPRLEAARDRLDPSVFKVMTFNIYTHNADFGNVITLIQDEQPDLVALQEVTPKARAVLEETLSDDYPYLITRGGGTTAQMILSRFPAERGFADLAESPWPTFRVKVNTPAGPVTVWNVHAFPPVRKVFWQFQRRVIEAVAQEVAVVEGPVIVLGDFNTTDQTENYNLLAHHLTDVHRAVGRGFGFTFPGSRIVTQSLPYLSFSPLIIPMLRLDMIFVSEHILPLDIRVVESAAGSDHRPVIATLQWRN